MAKENGLFRGFEIEEDEKTKCEIYELEFGDTYVLLNREQKV